MTKVFDIVNHRAMWIWLSENTNKKKWHWTGWAHNGGKVKNAIEFCFACEYDVNGACQDCPLVWNKEVCFADGGFYELWFTEKDSVERSRLALQIANLQVRSEVVTNG